MYMYVHVMICSYTLVQEKQPVTNCTLHWEQQRYLNTDYFMAVLKCVDLENSKGTCIDLVLA